MITADPDPVARPDPLSPEQRFLAQTDRGERKRRGQFFTPPAYARLMAEWIAASQPQTVLDPAVGTGLLLAACAQQGIPPQRMTGQDIDAAMLALAAERVPGALLQAGDFLATDPAARYDAVIANPPYVMQRDHDGDAAALAALSARAGLRLSGRSNLYVHFVVRIGLQLAPGGRAAVLIPAEWAQANYGQPLKAFLLARGLLHSLVTIDQAGAAFADNQATAAMLLLEQPDADQPSRTHIRSYHGAGAALPPTLAGLETAPGITRQTLAAESLAAAPKWDALLRTAPDPEAAPTSPISLGDLITSRRGIATGANGFFLMRPSEARGRGLNPARMDRCIGKAAQVSSTRFTARDAARLEAADAPCLLFNPPHPLTPAEQAYLAEGVALGVPARHGPRTKKLWYRAEARAPAPLWAGTFGRGRMRFVVNSTGWTTLTCFHNLYPRRDSAGEPLRTPAQIARLARQLNSPAMAPAIAAQTRAFASGLLKLEPRDILAIRLTGWR